MIGELKHISFAKCESKHTKIQYELRQDFSIPSRLFIR